MNDEQLIIKTDEDKKPSFSRYPEQFQINLAKLIIQDRAFSSQMQEVLELSYFENDYLKSLIDSIFKYKDKYGVHPAEDTVDMIISTQFRNIDQIKKNQIESFWSSYKKNRKIEDPDFYMKTALDFCRSQKMLEALKNSFDLLKEGSIDQFMDNISKAGSLGSSQNFGHDYKEDFEKRYEKDHREPITTGWDELDLVTKGGIGLGEVFVYVSPQSCHGEGTKVVTIDGYLKNIEDLRIGDKLIGPDSKERNVVDRIRGKSNLFKIKYIPHDNEDNISVTEEHNLALINIKTKKKIDMSVFEYNKQSKEFKRYHRLYKSDIIEFGNSTKVKEPYFLGLLLGDGYLASQKAPDKISLYNINETVISEAAKSAFNFGCNIIVEKYKDKCPRIRFPNSKKGFQKIQYKLGLKN
jgi:hypothetical protein